MAVGYYRIRICREPENSEPQGEELAVAWLRAHGFIIMDRNWRMGRYELDIVAARGDRVHFVEVKLRREGGLTRPEEAMTPAKGRGTAPGGQLLHRDLRG